MMRLILAVAALVAVISGGLFADRWIIEWGPVPTEPSPAAVTLATTCNLLLRHDLGELRGVELVSKSDVKSDILTLEFNRLSSAKGDERVLLGLYTRACGLISLDVAQAPGGSLKVTAIDLSQRDRQKEWNADFSAQAPEAAMARIAGEVAQFFGRQPTAEESARIARPTGLSMDSLTALAVSQVAKDPAECEKLARDVAKFSPTCALAQFTLARELGAAGKTLEAISACREANRLDGNEPSYHAELASLFMSDKRYDEAVAEFARAIALDPSDASAHDGLLRTLAAKGLANGAGLAEYRKLTAECAEIAVVRLNVGRDLLREGKLDEAALELRKASELAPKDGLVAYELARALDLGGKTDEAFAGYKQALDLGPNLAPAANYLGMIYEKKGKDKLALFYYSQAVKFAPDYALAWSNLGIIYGRQNQRELELDAFRHEVKLAPDDPVAHFNLGVALQKSGDVHAAIDQLKRAVELAPDDKPSHWQLAHAYERAGFLNLAAPEWKKVLALQPTPAERSTAEKHLKDIEGK